jgi:two-component system, OmpR family, response regulator
MSGLRVLYVDDEADIREITVMSLGLDAEIETRAAESGAEALELLARGDWQPDLIILDVMMPGMDGPTTLAKLRTFSATAETPVIFMTARAQAFERDRLMKLGALGVIPKPFDPMGLARQLRAMVRTAAAA